MQVGCLMAKVGTGREEGQALLRRIASRQGARSCHLFGILTLAPLLLDANRQECKKLLRAIHEIPCVKSKADWALRWISHSSSFAERLVAFACVEGIHFSGR